jgi:hypothetical protein
MSSVRLTAKPAPYNGETGVRFPHGAQKHLCELARRDMDRFNKNFEACQDCMKPIREDFKRRREMTKGAKDGQPR